ncbi:MAG TPA: threonylcarbamoyl-AMP synthase [Dehalococcoidia bacterium]|jgi:L-threonylcarbamoyladenylate synthase|nr:threonylcarbamoyl-AMP synthase [Dehalococcoidia bacterium]
MGNAKIMSDSELLLTSTILKNQGVVIIPTDTLYGIATSIDNETGINRIYQMKDRDQTMPLPVLVNSWEQSLSLIEGSSDTGYRLHQKFWPGALTMIFKKSKYVSNALTAGKDTVAIRMPAHYIPLYLTEMLGVPITGTSANHSGSPDITNLSDIPKTISNKIDHIVQSGPTPKGVPSTIIDLTGNEVKLIREGKIKFKTILREL